MWVLMGKRHQQYFTNVKSNYCGWWWIGIFLNGSLRQFGEWGVNLVKGNEYTHTRHFLPFDAFVSVHPKSPPVPVPLPLVNQSNTLCACRDSLHSPTTTAPRVACRTALFISCFAPHDSGGSTHARTTRVTGRESEYSNVIVLYLCVKAWS